MSASRKAVLVGMLVALVAACGCAGDPEVEKRQAIASGDEYAKLGRYQEAIIEYRRAVRIDSRSGDARLRLSDMYRRTGDIQRAFLEINRAADRLSNNADVQIEAGRWLLAAGRFEDAQNRADFVLKKNPQHAAALILRGNALARLKDFYAALEDMEKAVAAAPDDGLPYASLAVLRFARGEEEAADAAFIKALELEPNDPIVHLAYTNFLLSSKRFTDAEAQLQRAAKLAPENVLVTRAMAGFYVATSQPARAEPYLIRLADTSGDPAANFALARLYMGLGRHMDAVRVLNTLASENATTAEAKLQLAAVSFGQGQRAQAYQLIEEVLPRTSERARALLLKSGFLLEENKPEEAIDSARMAVETDPLLAKGYFILGLAYTVLGKYDDARRAFDEELRREPRDVRPLIGLSRLELASGNLQRALELADRAANEAPTAPAVRVAVLRVKLAAGNLDDAEREVKGIRAAKFNSADSYLLEGQLRMAQRNRQAARDAFAKAAEMAPQSLAVATELIQLDLGEGQIRAARARADELARRSPDSAPTLLLVGRTYATSNDFATAEKFFRNAITVDASMGAGYAALGGLYLRQGRGPEALKEFQALAAARPEWITAQTMVGALLEGQGRREQAKQAYRKALDTDPNAIVAANNLAWMMAEDNENIDEALRLAEGARTRLPGSPDVADTLGWIYYKKGLYSVALGALKEAVQKQPANVEFLYHLGLASARAGEDQLARQSLERALKLEPNSRYAADARTALPRLRTRG